MNLTEIQQRLDEALKAISIGGPYHDKFGILRLHEAFQLLVNELARLQPEHPELTEEKGKETK